MILHVYNAFTCSKSWWRGPWQNKRPPLATKISPLCEEISEIQLVLSRFALADFCEDFLSIWVHRLVDILDLISSQCVFVVFIFASTRELFIYEVSYPEVWKIYPQKGPQRGLHNPYMVL